MMTASMKRAVTFLIRHNGSSNDWDISYLAACNIGTAKRFLESLVMLGVLEKITGKETGNWYKPGPRSSQWIMEQPPLNNTEHPKPGSRAEQAMYNILRREGMKTPIAGWEVITEQQRTEYLKQFRLNTTDAAARITSE